MVAEQLKLQEILNKVDQGKITQLEADQLWLKAWRVGQMGHPPQLSRQKKRHYKPERDPDDDLVWDSYYFQDQARRQYGKLAGGGGRGSGRPKKARAPAPAPPAAQAAPEGETEAPEGEAVPAAQAVPATAPAPEAPDDPNYITPQKSKRQIQLTFASASPEQSPVEAAMSPGYVPGRLLLDKLELQKRKGGRPSTGKLTGIQSPLEPESKTNKKGLGSASRRRDATASERLHICNIFGQLGASTAARAKKLSRPTWSMLMARFGRNKPFLMACLQRRKELQSQIAEARLGKYGLRPFGSNLANQKRQSRGLKARIDRSKILKPAEGTKKEPLRGVLFQLQKFLDQERMRRNEVRPTHIRTRFTAQLKVEKDVQNALHEAKSPAYQPYVLRAVEERLQAYQDPTYDKRKYERTSVWPKIGGRARFGGKLTSSVKNPDKGLCLLGWATMDHAQWLIAKGSQEQLAMYVRDPDRFQKNRHLLKKVEFDQTAFWGKLKGEEPVLLAAFEIDQDCQTRQVKRWMQQGETHQDRRVVQAMIDALQEEIGNRPRQHRQLFSQGGDKHRWTVITNLTQVGWFDPDCQTPRSQPLRYIVLVQCSKLVRIDYITNQHTWAKTHTVRNADGTLDTRYEGQPTGGVLRTWVQMRISYPDHEFWVGHTVWGQHSAWACKGVATMLQMWLGEPEQCPDGALTVCDCLAAQWSPEALFHAWDNNLFQVPVPPNSTAYLQGPDTILHAMWKAICRHHKEAIQEEGERACAQADPPEEYQPNWAPAELMELLARTRTETLERDQKKDMCLTSGCSNQTFIFRPDQQGDLRLIDDQVWATKYPREPPGKGIAPAWAKARLEMAQRWPDGVPPEPDWEALDTACYLEVDDQPPEPQPDDVVLDFRLQDIDMTPAERKQMLPIEARILELEVPAIIRDRQLAMASASKRRNGRRSQWSRKLEKRYAQDSATSSWNKRIRGQGAAELRQSMLPQVSKSKQDKKKAKPEATLTPAQEVAKRKMSGENKWVKAARQRRAGPGAAPAPGTGDAEAAPEPQDEPEHQLMKKIVRVTSENAREEWIGLTGLVTKVTRTTSGEPAQLMILTDEDDQGKRVQVVKVPETYVQLGRGDVTSIRPVKLNYHEFGPVKRQIARWQVLGTEASESLEEVQPGTMIEQSTMAALIQEGKARLPYTDQYVILPTEATALAFPEEPDENTQLQLATIDTRLQYYLMVAIFVFWPQHYTLLIASRPGLQTEDGQPAKWSFVYQDSLQTVSNSNYQAAQRIARRIGLLPHDQPLPPPSNIRHQRGGDGWSCGLWCTRWWEEAVRQRLGEPRTPVQSLQLLWGRGNAFIAQIKKARKDPPKGKPPAGAPASRKEKVEPATFMEALHAAHLCTKCRATQMGTKGCAECMGKWFEEIRIR